MLVTYTGRRRIGGNPHWTLPLKRYSRPAIWADVVVTKTGWKRVGGDLYLLEVGRGETPFDNAAPKIIRTPKVGQPCR